MRSASTELDPSVAVERGVLSEYGDIAIYQSGEILLLFNL